MPYAFNPFTGTLDYFRSGSTGTSTDFQSGYYVIDSSQSIEIPEKKQSTTWGMLSLEGTMLVEGQFISEA
jgi:hypothetical protein